MQQRNAPPLFGLPRGSVAMRSTLNALTTAVAKTALSCVAVTCLFAACATAPPPRLECPFTSAAPPLDTDTDARVVAEVHRIEELRSPLGQGTELTRNQNEEYEELIRRFRV